MFKFDPNHAFNRVIEVAVPVDDGTETHKLKVRYRRVGLDALAKFDLSDPVQQLAYCDAIVDSFLDVIDDHGKVVPPGPEMKAQMLNTAFIRIPVMRSYELAMLGAQAKN